MNENNVEETPIEMILFCPICNEKHIDYDEWATKPHKTHLCLSCGNLFKPTQYNTVGVEELKK